ncbi:hypothetical protein HELRODRAFT_190923 [Helobdella robusta]|uniref:Ubiquitin carboxyl-terminal hydrolase n=1 Tax=Helobdella robusta TaxID=6412 RepID=T1FSF2_HELRO|nr:hypothetical protein HELRODRAFT_190923 [Helobdella robusta]ESO08168.1 hypothetical protein HELRODRAFT_190923 [Helobdella robusta]
MVQPHNVALFCGIASIFSATLYYLLKKPESLKLGKDKKSPCPGLMNLGNTCFLNSILQALSPCKLFVDWLEFILDHSTYMNKNSLVFEVYATLKILNNESIEHTEDYNPKPVLNKLASKGWVISNGEHDASELFHVLMESLNEELIVNPSTISLFDISTLEKFRCLLPDEAVNNISTSLPKLNSSSPLPSSSSSSSPSFSSSSSLPPFFGRLASQLICKYCGSRNPMSYQTFCCLSLPLPPNKYGLTTLELLLKNYLQSENIDEAMCEKCKVKRPFIKRTTIGKLPHSLCIHLQRTTWSSVGAYKRMDQVTIPDHIDLGQYLWRGTCGFSGAGGIISEAVGLGGLSLLGPKIRDVQKVGLLGGKLKEEKMDEESVAVVGGDSGDGDGDKLMKRMDLLASSVDSQKMLKRRKMKNKICLTNPYSISVNMLKALNYYSHLSSLGLQNASVKMSPATNTTSSSSSSSLSIDTSSSSSSSTNISSSSSSSSSSTPSRSSAEFDLANRKTILSPTRTTTEIPKELTMLADAYESEYLCCRKMPKNGGNSSTIYRLSSVIVHYGDVSSGHFVAYRRSPTRFGVRFPDRHVCERVFYGGSLFISPIHADVREVVIGPHLKISGMDE